MNAKCINRRNFLQGAALAAMTVRFGPRTAPRPHALRQPPSCTYLQFNETRKGISSDITQIDFSGYPQSNATRRGIEEELLAIAGNKDKGMSFYLDTLESHNNSWWSEGKDHHQGLARTHKLSDGSIYFFLSHSETDKGDKGNVMQFRYRGPVNGEHVIQTSPLTVAPMMPLMEVKEQHPCDMTFLGDVNNADSGYLFVADGIKGVSIFHWLPAHKFAPLGSITPGFPQGTPNFVFADRVGDQYFLGIGNSKACKVRVYRASASVLFPSCLPGKMNTSAFERVVNPSDPSGVFPFPISDATNASQVELIRDVTGGWFLLVYRCNDPESDQNAPSYVDLHRVQFSPFGISSRIKSFHIPIRVKKVSFASTGMHYVEKSGRLLIASSYRWSDDQGPGNSSYVSRVHEIAS